MVEHQLEFEWNPVKAAANLKKHGVSFTEAATAFDDDFAYAKDDEFHSDDEPRQIMLGYSEQNRLLFISFAERGPNLIRIIGARLTDRLERKAYENKRRK